MRVHMRMVSLALAVACPAASADSLDLLRTAASGGTPNLDARLRYEAVEQDNALEEAQACTLRMRLGYTTEAWNDFDASAEYEGVFPIADDDYNSTANDRAAFSMVADPEGSELNQAWLRYSGLPGTTLKYGRQRIVFDNARFIGNVGWRQNEQTYDGFMATHASIPKTRISYAHLTNVNAFRMFPVGGVPTDDIHLAGDLLNVNVAPFPLLNLTGYAYLLDFQEAVAQPARQDTRTLGARLTGALAMAPVTLSYALEFAKQRDYADAAATVDADYGLAEVGAAWGPVNSRVGYEARGGDGVYSLQTPLATAHAFNGWADQFVAAPAAGLRDFYVALGGVVEKVTLLARHHDFRSDFGDTRYGTELDLLASRPLVENFVVSLKYADYSARTFSVDTTKVWASAEYKF